MAILYNSLSLQTRQKTRAWGAFGLFPISVQTVLQTSYNSISTSEFLAIYQKDFYLSNYKKAFQALGNLHIPLEFSRSCRVTHYIGELFVVIFTCLCKENTHMGAYWKGNICQNWCSGQGLFEGSLLRGWHLIENFAIR